MTYISVQLDRKSFNTVKRYTAHLSVIFDFFSVVAYVLVFAVQLHPGHGQGGSERDALVGRTEYHVKLHTGFSDCHRVEPVIWRENQMRLE